MLVKMVHRISGTRDGIEWPTPGNTIDLPDDEALALIASGAAVEGEAEVDLTPKPLTTKSTK